MAHEQALQTMQEEIERFCNYMRYERNASELTIRDYGKDLQAYSSHCEQLLGASHSPTADDLDLVRSWLMSMMEDGKKASYVSRRLAAIKSFYRYLLKMGRIHKNPVRFLKAPRGEKPLPVYVPTQEIENILNEKAEEGGIKAVLEGLVIATLYECGLRRSELASLLDKDVDTIGRKLKVLGKGNKERIIPFGEGLAKEMDLWRAMRNEEFGESKTFFLTLKGREMKGEDVYAIVHPMLVRVPNLARRGAHALRHSFATDMLNNGAELVAIKELMGHSNVSTTVQYTHTSFRQLQQMYNAHPRAKKKE